MLGGAQHRLDGNDSSYHNSLAWLLATCPDEKLRDGDQAIEHAKSACELTKWKNHYCHDTLAVAYAEMAKFEEAVRWQKKALDFPGLPKEAIEPVRLRLKLYEQVKAYRAK
jgi:hypothetical protein